MKDTANIQKMEALHYKKKVDKTRKIFVFGSSDSEKNFASRQQAGYQNITNFYSNFHHLSNQSSLSINI